MAKKKRTKARAPERRQQKARARRWLLELLALFVVFGVGTSLYFLRSRELPEVPDPDRSVMESQVAAKIASHREAVFQDRGSHEAWGRLGMVFHAHGLDAEAVQAYERAATLEARDFRWHYLWAHALRQIDRGAALERAARAGEIREDYGPLYALRGELLEEDGALDQASRMYRKALTFDDNIAKAEFGLGRIARSRGDYHAALEHLQRASELSPRAGSVHAALAQVYRRLGDQEAAVREAKIASEHNDPVGVEDPVHVRMTGESVSSIAQLRRAQAADEAGEFARSERIYRELVGSRPEDADMHARLGDALARQSKRDQAKEAYRKALELNAYQPAALYGLGNMLNLEGSHDQALRHYRKALEVRGDHVPTLVNLGSLLAYQGKPAEAEKLFRQALEVEPASFAPHRQLGLLLSNQKKFEEAVAYFQAALEVRPEFGPLHVELAIALAVGGEFRKAREHVSRAQELGETVSPDLVEALQNRSRNGSSLR